MSAEPLEIHIIADSTGESATRVARAAAAQFLGTEIIYVRHRRMASRAKIEAVLQELEHSRQGKPTVVLYTLVEPELVQLVTAACDSLGFAHADLMTPALEAIEAASGLAADAVARRPVGVEAEYFQRMAAIDFAVRNDDGIAPADGVERERRRGAGSTDDLVEGAVDVTERIPTKEHGRPPLLRLNRTLPSYAGNLTMQHSTSPAV